MLRCDGDFRLLRVRSSNGTTSVLMRLAGERFVYHEYHLKKTDEEVLASYVYLYYIGEFQSELWRRAALLVAKESVKYWRAWAQDREEEYICDYAAARGMALSGTAARNTAVTKSRTRSFDGGPER